ncbi:hypothetical protein BGZ94_003854 [Podila epigama]|nr:hypothetical protein BGZ94_003854 [Podila epigama]
MEGQAIKSGGSKRKQANPSKKSALQTLDTLLANAVAATPLPLQLQGPPSQDHNNNNNDSIHNDTAVFSEPRCGFFDSNPQEQRRQSFLVDPPSPSTSQALVAFLQENVEGDDHLMEILRLQEQHERQQQQRRRLLQQQQKMYKEQQQRLLEEQKQHQEHLNRQYKLGQQQKAYPVEDVNVSSLDPPKVIKKESSPEQHHRQQQQQHLSLRRTDPAPSQTPLSDHEQLQTPPRPSSPSHSRRSQQTPTPAPDEAQSDLTVRSSSRTPKRRYKKTILRQQAAYLAAQIKDENDIRDQEATRRIMAHAAIVKHLRSLRSWLLYAHFKVHCGWEDQPLHIISELFEEELEQQSEDSDDSDDQGHSHSHLRIAAKPEADKVACVPLPQDWNDADDENDIDDGVATPEPLVRVLVTSSESESDSDSDHVQITPCVRRTQHQNAFGNNNINNNALRQTLPGPLLFEPKNLCIPPSPPTPPPPPVFSRISKPVSRTSKQQQLPQKCTQSPSDTEEELAPWTPRKPSSTRKLSVVDLLPISLTSAPKTQEELLVQQRLQLEELQRRQLEQLRELQQLQQEQQLALQQAQARAVLTATPVQSSPAKADRSAHQATPEKKARSKKLTNGTYDKENLAPLAPEGTPPLTQVQKTLALQKLQQQQRQLPPLGSRPRASYVSGLSPTPSHRTTPTKLPKPVLQHSASRSLHMPLSDSKTSGKSSTAHSGFSPPPKNAQRHTSCDESDEQLANVRSRKQKQKHEQQNPFQSSEQNLLKVKKPSAFGGNKESQQAHLQKLLENDIKERQLRQREQLQYQQLEEKEKYLLELQEKHKAELAKTQHERELLEREQQQQQQQRQQKRSKEPSPTTCMATKDGTPTKSLDSSYPLSSRPTASDTASAPMAKAMASPVTPLSSKKKKPLNPIHRAPSSENILASVRTSNLSKLLPGVSMAKGIYSSNKRVLSVAEDKENLGARSPTRTKDVFVPQASPLQELAFSCNGFKRQRQKSASPGQDSTTPPPSSESAPSSGSEHSQLSLQVNASAPAGISAVEQTLIDPTQVDVVLSDILSASAVTSSFGPATDSAAFTAALIEASISPQLLDQPAQVPATEQAVSNAQSNAEFMQCFDQWMSDIGNDEATDYTLADNINDGMGFQLATMAATETDLQTPFGSVATPLQSEEVLSHCSELEDETGDGGDTSELDRLLYTDVGVRYRVYETPQSSDLRHESQDMLTSDAAVSGSEVYDWFPDTDHSHLLSDPIHPSSVSSSPALLSSQGQGLEELDYDPLLDTLWQQDYQQELQLPSSSRDDTPALDSTGSSLLSSVLSDMLESPSMPFESPRAKHYQPMGFGGQLMMAQSPLSVSQKHNEIEDEDEEEEEQGQEYGEDEGVQEVSQI